MPAVGTVALVLHAFDYLETSRIYRLLTREAGVQSVLARGARRSRSRYGSAVDLFAEGEAQLSIKPTRELQTLMAFDVTRARPGLAASLERFTAASTIAELALRFARDDAQPSLYDAVRDSLDAIATSGEEPGAARDAALGGAWHIVAQLGFAPALDDCCMCQSAIPEDDRAAFSHTTGGLLCRSCATIHRASRLLPPAARHALQMWTRGAAWQLSDPGEGRAHQRLLREFLGEHLMDGRSLRAFEVWERSAWSRSEIAAPGAMLTSRDPGVAP